jgi:hypothetical protein
MNDKGSIRVGGDTAGQSIAKELQKTNTSAQLNLNDTEVRRLAGKPTGAINMPQDFYGKQYQAYGYAILADWYRNRTGLFRNTAGYSSSPGSNFNINTYPGQDSTTSNHYNSYSVIQSADSFYFSIPGAITNLSPHWTSITGIVSYGSPYFNSLPSWGGIATPDIRRAGNMTVGSCAEYWPYASGQPPAYQSADYTWYNWDGDDNLGMIGFSIAVPGYWEVLSVKTSQNAPVGSTYTWTVPAGCICVIGNSTFNGSISFFPYWNYTGPAGTYMFRGENVWYKNSCYMIVFNGNNYDTTHTTAVFTLGRGGAAVGPFGRTGSAGGGATMVIYKSKYG